MQGVSAAEVFGGFCHPHRCYKLTLNDEGSRLLRNVVDNIAGIRSHNLDANCVKLPWMKFLRHAMKKNGKWRRGSLHS